VVSFRFRCNWREDKCAASAMSATVRISFKFSRILDTTMLGATNRWSQDRIGGCPGRLPLRRAMRSKTRIEATSTRDRVPGSGSFLRSPDTKVVGMGSPAASLIVPERERKTSSGHRLVGKILTRPKVPARGLCKAMRSAVGRRETSMTSIRLIIGPITIVWLSKKVSTPVTPSKPKPEALTAPIINGLSMRRLKAPTWEFPSPSITKST
jgi:hypothetical protein